MAHIPIEVTEEQFNKYIKPHLSVAKRGYQSKIPLFQLFNLMLAVLQTDCQWHKNAIPVDSAGKPLISWQTPRYHFYKWRQDGSLDRLCRAGILKIRYNLDVSRLT